MVSKEIAVHHLIGLHERPASELVQKASEFVSSIYLVKDERRKANAKSLLGVLSLGIMRGAVVTITADGADEKEAIEALSSLIESNFPE